MKRQIISLTLSFALFSAGCMPGIASAGTIVMNDNRGAVETEAEPVTDDQLLMTSTREPRSTKSLRRLAWTSTSS